MKITNPTQQQKDDAEKRQLKSIMPFFLFWELKNINTENYWKK